MAKVVCLGLAGADVVGKPIEALPQRGTLGLLDRIELHTGGCAANTGVSLAILGVPTAIIAKVGDDGFGDFIVSRFQRYGIDTSGMVRAKDASSASTMVFVHADGERSFLHYYGANATFCREDIDFKKIEECEILHVAGAFLMPALDGEPTAELLRSAKAKGKTTALDTVWDPQGRWLEVIAPALPHTDYFLPNYDEGRMLAGGREDPAEIAQFLVDAGAKVVGLKLGEQGCYFRTADGTSLMVPARKVELVDALGAGDAFVAGFLTGLSRGWDLEQCARFAVVVGGCCVSALGATTGIKSFEETLKMMEG